jgi:transposase
MMTDGSAEPVSGGAGEGCGVLREYVRPQRDQMFLLPVSMRDWLEPGHLAWFVLDVVAEIDTRALHARPAGALGRRPFEPEMMLALVLYGYCCGVRFSRRLEAACRTDAAFRVICGGLEPDHATIARFVADHERALEGLFVEGLRLCDAAGLIDLSVVALDGTKIAADASLQSNRSGEWIRGEVAKLMAQTGQDAHAADQLGTDPVLPGTEIPSPPSSRLARLQAALGVVDAEDQAAAEETARRSAAAAAAADRGVHLKGRKPKDPWAALARAEVDHQLATERLAGMQTDAAARRTARERGEPRQPGLPKLRIARATATLARAEQRLAAARAAVKGEPAPTAAVPRANVTDPDSRIMSTKDGWVQGYNCQAIANPNQIVLACEVTQDANDVQQYEPMIALLGETLTRAGIIDPAQLALADAGYWSEHNATCPGIDRLIATLTDHKQRRAARELGHTDGPPPPDATESDQMEHLLRTPQGAAAYAQRSQLIEPVFGDRKHNRNTRRFRRRGLPAARSEWAFINLAGNLLKLHQHRASIA